MTVHVCECIYMCVFIFACVYVYTYIYLYIHEFDQILLRFVYIKIVISFDMTLRFHFCLFFKFDKLSLNKL